MTPAEQQKPDLRARGLCRSGPSRPPAASPQLTAMVNSSPRLQALAQLKADLQDNPRTQNIMGLADVINQGPADTLTAGRERLSGVSLDNASVQHNPSQPAQLRNGKKPNKSKPASKPKTKEVGGAQLSWNPVIGGQLVRYAEAGEIDDQGTRYTGRGDDKATWFVDTFGVYQPSMDSKRPFVVTLPAGWTVTNPQNIWMNVENPLWGGEAQQPGRIIVKENEKGAYGIGKNIIASLLGRITVTENSIFEGKKSKNRPRRR